MLSRRAKEPGAPKTGPVGPWWEIPPRWCSWASRDQADRPLLRHRNGVAPPVERRAGATSPQLTRCTPPCLCSHTSRNRAGRVAAPHLEARQITSGRACGSTVQYGLCSLRSRVTTSSLSVYVARVTGAVRYQRNYTEGGQAKKIFFWLFCTFWTRVAITAPRRPKRTKHGPKAARVLGNQPVAGFARRFGRLARQHVRCDGAHMCLFRDKKM